jgi:3-oxoacyl-[acyl-carrier-protein] synthase-3
MTLTDASDRSRTSPRAATSLRVAGIAHVVGSGTVSNTALAESMGLSPDWFVRRTGIVERRVCGPGQDVTTMAVEAVRQALEDAGLSPQDIGPETVLLHVQNGMTVLTPPAGVLLASALGFGALRVLSVDGVCAEPVAMLDIASMMLANGVCERAIISASVDFLPIINPADTGTAGLFGAGAGAVVLERTDAEEPGGGTDAASRRTAITVESIHWATHPEWVDLGRIPVIGHEPNDQGVLVQAGYYDMNGAGLIRAGRQVVPQLVARVLDESGWRREDLDLVLSHQPNVRMLETTIDVLGLDRAIFPMPVVHHGNLGPASILVNLSVAAKSGAIRPGARLLFLAFGLGFSCGVAAIRVGSDSSSPA